MILFSSLEHIFTTIKTKFKIVIFCISTGPHRGVCGIFRPPCTGGSNELISKFSSSMILYNRPSYFKSGEINSCRLSPLPIHSTVRLICIDWLTGGNWQKWKRVFLTCPCHEIYRDEAVGLKSCKNTWKITIFVKMWNLGQYHENLIFCQ